MTNKSKALQRLQRESHEVWNEYIREEDVPKSTQLLRIWSKKIECLLSLEAEQCEAISLFFNKF